MDLEMVARTIQRLHRRMDFADGVDLMEYTFIQYSMSLLRPLSAEVCLNNFVITSNSIKVL